MFAVGSSGGNIKRNKTDLIFIVSIILWKENKSENKENYIYFTWAKADLGKAFLCSSLQCISSDIQSAIKEYSNVLVREGLLCDDMSYSLPFWCAENGVGISIILP